MDDFIDHQLIRSFGSGNQKNGPQPRMPSLFEDWENDSINTGEEEETGPVRVPLPTELQTPEISPFVVDLTADASQLGILLPPIAHRNAEEKINPHHGPTQLPSDIKSPPTPAEPPQPIAASIDYVPQSVEVGPIVPVPASVELTTAEPGTPIPDPFAPISQPPLFEDGTPEPVQPAPAALVTEDPTIARSPDIKTNVRVHIGRIEVQLPQPSKPPSPGAAPPAKARIPFRPPMSLQNYLEKRRR